MSDTPATGPETGFAELVAATNYSFLRGASHPAEMVAEAIALGMAGIGIADRNSVAGVVRALTGLRKLREDATEEGIDLPNIKLVVGARLRRAAGGLGGGFGCCGQGGRFGWYFGLHRGTFSIGRF